MTSLLQKNIVLYLFIVSLIVGITGCKPRVSPKGHVFLDKVSRDINVLATNIKQTIFTKNASNAVEVIHEWVKNTPVSTNQYLAIGLLDSAGTDFFSYDLVKQMGEVSKEKGDYSNYKAMQPLLKGNKFSTGIIHWESIPYGIVCRAIEAGGTNCCVVVLFISPEAIKDADITIKQFSDNLL